MDKENQSKRKTTQGHTKMMLHIEDTIRNQHFLKRLKQLRKATNPLDKTKGMYNEWTDEQKERHDWINKELGEIINDYEKLRKRCQRVMYDKRARKAEQIANEYSFDNALLNVAIGMKDGNDFYINYYGDEIDMCTIQDLQNEELNQSNKGDNFIYLRPDRQRHLIAYPVAVDINTKASKRDVLDFIEKRWPEIDAKLRMSETKALKLKINKKRKLDRALIDFIWLNKHVPSKKIKGLLDKKFPENDLVCYEINDIIKREKKKRLEE